jgi:hypothetical protein
MFAASPPSNPQNPAASFILIGAIIAGLRRHLTIGGWLYFFFWGIFVGLALTIFGIYNERAFLVPTTWRDQTKYLLYMLSLGPRVASFLFVAAASGVALARRDALAASTLRLALAAYIMCQLLTVAIDAFRFPQLLNIAAAGVIFPMSFFLYSFRSRRFHSVFLHR